MIRIVQFFMIVLMVRIVLIIVMIVLMMRLMNLIRYGDDEKDVDECKDNGDDDVDHCSENTNSNAMLMRMTFPTIVIVPLGGGGGR